MSAKSKVVPIPLSAVSDEARPRKNILKVGTVKPQVPSGIYTAKCIHVEPDWTYLKNRKVALFFEVHDGACKGMEARRFYPLKLLENGEYEIASKSKLMEDILKLFPGCLQLDELDVVSLFKGKFFTIEVVGKRSKKTKIINAIVESLDHFDPGW